VLVDHLTRGSAMIVGSAQRTARSGRICAQPVIKAHPRVRPPVTIT
jgi:hypothetical protein